MTDVDRHSHTTSKSSYDGSINMQLAVVGLRRNGSSFCPCMHTFIVRKHGLRYHVEKLDKHLGPVFGIIHVTESVVYIQLAGGLAIAVTLLVVTETRQRWSWVLTNFQARCY